MTEKTQQLTDGIKKGLELFNLSPKITADEKSMNISIKVNGKPRKLHFPLSKEILEKEQIDAALIRSYVYKIISNILLTELK